MDEDALRHLSRNHADPSEAEQPAERMWRWSYSVLGFDGKQNLQPGDATWGRVVLGAVIGPQNIRKNLSKYVKVLNNKHTYSLLMLMTPFPYFTSQAVISEARFREVYLDQTKYSAFVSARSTCFPCVR